MSDSDCVESPSLAGGEGGACGGPQGARNRAHARPDSLLKKRIVSATSSRHVGSSSVSSARRLSSAWEKPDDPNENSDARVLAESNELVALEGSDEGVGVDGGGTMPRKIESTCRPHCDGLLSSSWRSALQLFGERRYSAEAKLRGGSWYTGSGVPRRRRSSAGGIYQQLLANLLLHPNPWVSLICHICLPGLTDLERLIEIPKGLISRVLLRCSKNLEVMGIKVLIYVLTQHMMVACNKGYNAFCHPSSSATTSTEVLPCRQ